ncbi:hypothetical protein THAOC_11146 [Thalassiosira oceanica]|uniref:Uncharacterized protein n=1 Tax=Thalassiosira oceanica TaxID=159749 RepID=K0SQX5_THAOC|nr:hypothetical protein THAOC_11146 [Thalassiosira oceanica]|eukprot:EJK67780.1 hypothetical protein THAOC_11146 [Thalassiosira oceanica]
MPVRCKGGAPIVIFSTRPIGPDPPRGTKIIKLCGSLCFYEAGRKFTSAGSVWSCPQVESACGQEIPTRLFRPAYVIVGS